MESNLLACNSNWLGTTGQNTKTITIDSCIPYINYQPYYYPIYYSSPARPIKLTLSEIEKLRKVAKDDKSIKDILMKFTALIEITVDF
jgi:hypothetical protein